MFGGIGDTPFDVGQEVLHDPRPGHSVLLGILDRQSTDRAGSTGIVVFDLHGKGQNNSSISSLDAGGGGVEAFRKGPQRQIKIALAKELKAVVAVQMIEGHNGNLSSASGTNNGVGLAKANLGGAALRDQHVVGKGDSSMRCLFQNF